MKIEELPLSVRAAITFIPCIFIAFFDPLLAFCLFIVLFEKCIIAIFPMPGIELTTLATFLLALKYELITALFYAILIPSVVASILRFLFWKEFLRPDEPPFTFGAGNLIDMGVVVACRYLKNFNLSMLYLMGIILVFKHTLGYLKNTLTGIPDVISPVVSTILNIFLILIFGSFFLWLINA